MRILAALLLLLLALPAAGQAANPGPASPERDRGWFAFGLGPSTTYPVAFAATANVGRTRFVQVGFHANTELLSGTASANVLNVGGGLSQVGPYHRVALAVGPGVVWGERGDADRRRYATAGLVVSAQAMATPVRELGLGLDAFVNLNPVQTAAGVAVTFVFEGNK